VIRLAAAMYRFGYHCQQYEVLAWGHGAARLSTKHHRLPVALGAAATHAWGRGDLAAARRLADRAVLAAPDRQAPGTHAAHEVLGDVALVSGDAATALTHYRAMVAAGRRAGSGAIEADGLSGVALVLAWSGDVAEGQQVGGSAVELAEASGNPSARAFAAYCLGETLGDTDPPRALALLSDAATLSRSVRNRLFEGAAATAAVAIRSRHGDPAAALINFHEVLTLWRSAGNDTLQATALRNLVVLLARVGADEAAATIDHALRTEGAPQLYRAEADRMSRARTVVTERLGRTRLAQIERHAAALSPPQVLDAALDAITGQLARLGRSIVDHQIY
jgi:hypothetical protein